jgi:DNA-3-methyladenine glycosylase I
MDRAATSPEAARPAFDAARPAFDPDLPRCAWAAAGGPRPDPMMVAYHDDEWGVPVDGDTELFERLALEGFQAGLSWTTILRKRDAFRAAFRGFDPALVARFGAIDRERLLADAGIVRNRAKIDATIANAARLLELVDEAGSFAAYLADRVPPPAALPVGTTMDDLPARTPVSDALSADLRRRGFGFVGSTIVYAFMQSVGLVDDHLPGCFRYRG